MYITFIYGAARLFTSAIYILIYGLCSTRRTHMFAFENLKYYALSMGLGISF